MARFIVYTYDIPKLSDDRKSVLPISVGESREFDEPTQAKAYAEEKKAAFDRIAVMEEDDHHHLCEQYVDGELFTPQG